MVFDKTYFERVFRQEDPWGYRLGQFEERKYLRQIEAIRQFRPEPTDILEIGCAEGIHTFMMAREFPGARVTGIDISKAAVERASKTCGECGNVCVIEGDVVELFRNGQMKDSSFDVIVQSATLYYMLPGLVTRNNLTWYLRRLVDLLKDGGIFVTSNETNLPTRWAMELYYLLLKRHATLVHSSKHTDWNEFRKRDMGYDLRVFVATG